MKPKDVLELRADLAAKLSVPRYRGAMAEIMRMGTGAMDYYGSRYMADYAAKSIISAENFFVVPEMCDLVAYSSSVLDSSDISDKTLVPSQSGFAYFEKPIEIVDIRQKKIFLNAILWETATDDSTVVHMWNDEYSHPDDAARFVLEHRATLSGADLASYDKWLAVKGRWGYTGVAIYRDGELVGDEKQEVSEELAAKYADVEGIETAPFTNPRRIVHAFFLMLSQTLVARETERGDKKVARRMKQMGVPNDVTVITFRRTKYEKKMEGPANVEWSHRWLVRGFWRWQPYKNEKGEWDRKRIWINPFIKGPEDKPLVITNKINAFVR